MSEVLPAVQVHVGNWPDPAHDDIEGNGMSFSTAAANERLMILPQDPLRLRAWLTTDAIVYIGTKTAINSPPSFTTTNVNHQAARIPASTSPIEITAQNEIWLASSSAANIGIWVERRVR